MRVVLDTDVLVSGLLNPNGPPAAILNLFANTKLKLIYDNRILQEYEEALHRERFGFESDRIAALIAFLQDEGEYVSAEPSKRPVRAYFNRAFYEVMIAGEADFLITGNVNHFPKEDGIINYRYFVMKWNEGTG